MSYLIKINKQFEKYTNICSQMKAIYENNNINIKLPWNFNDQDFTTIFRKQIVYSKDKIYNNSNEITNYTNFVGFNSRQLLSIMKYIQINKILILSSNINFADTCLGILKNIKIILLVYNNKEIGSFLKLKEKYKDNIDIYYIGNNLNYDVINIIKNILSENKIKLFNTIIIDSTTTSIYNHQENSIVTSILLSKYFLEKDGCLILFANLPYQNNFYTYCLNLLYEQYMFHNLNEISTYAKNCFISNIFVFSNLINKISDKDEEFITNYNTNNTNINYKYNELFLENILLRWKSLNYNYSEILYNIKQNVDKKVKRLSYHKNIIYHKINKDVPETINDLTNLAEYIGDARDFQSRCHWGQKKLLLSEIQFLTKVCQKLNTKTLKDYAVVYVGAAHGFHFPILYNMFPDLIWLLYDPAKFSKEAYMHTQKEKVKIFNQFFTDDTINHAKKNAENKKILFISDIRLTPNEEAIMKDMTSQAKWGTELSADFMLLKYKPPYEDENTKQFKTNIINDLQVNPNYIKNPELKADDKTFLYLKGDIYIQLFAHIHSVELRLMVEKVNNKYELDTISYGDIEKKMFYFNTSIRNLWSTEDYDFLHYIPGYDSSIECVMEYFIIKNYYEYFHNIKDNNIIIQKMFDMVFYLEKLAHTTFINCNYDTMVRTIKKFQKENDENKLKRLKLWKEISKLNIESSAKTQKEIIINTGNKIIGKDRVNIAIKYLNNYITDRTFIKIE